MKEHNEKTLQKFRELTVALKISEKHTDFIKVFQEYLKLDGLNKLMALEVFKYNLPGRMSAWLERSEIIKDMFCVHDWWYGLEEDKRERYAGELEWTIIVSYAISSEMESIAALLMPLYGHKLHQSRITDFTNPKTLWARNEFDIKND